MSRKEKKLYNAIIELLKSKNLYEKTDEMLVSEIIFLQSIIEQAKRTIAEQGIMINVRTSDKEPLFQVNQAVSIYKDSIKSLVTLSTKLGITPQERSKLKLVEKNDLFDVNAFLNEND